MQAPREVVGMELRAQGKSYLGRKEARFASRGEKQLGRMAVQRHSEERRNIKQLSFCTAPGLAEGEVGSGVDSQLTYQTPLHSLPG